MRKDNNFFVVYALLVVAQMLICNYFHITPYITLSLLPVLVLCIPIKYSTVFALFVAFATGLVTDAFAEGVIGLNTLAIVPVAFIRRPLIRAVFGDGLFARKEDFSVRRSGLGKVSTALLIAQALFLLIYIAADGAGTRPLWFNAARFAASLAAGYAASIFLVDILAPDDRR